MIEIITTESGSVYEIDDIAKTWKRTRGENAATLRSETGTFIGRSTVDGRLSLTCPPLQLKYYESQFRLIVSTQIVSREWRATPNSSIGDILDELSKTQEFHDWVAARFQKYVDCTFDVFDPYTNGTMYKELEGVEPVSKRAEIIDRYQWQNDTFVGQRLARQGYLNVLINPEFYDNLLAERGKNGTAN